MQAGMYCLCCQVCLVRAMQCELQQVDWTEVPMTGERGAEHQAHNL